MSITILAFGSKKDIENWLRCTPSERKEKGPKPRKTVKVKSRKAFINKVESLSGGQLWLVYLNDAGEVMGSWVAAHDLLPRA